MDKFNQLKSLVASIEQDADKFYNKNSKAAGTRVRKGLQEIKTMASEIRKEVTEIKNKEK
ncbi:histone H1 [Rubrolithibacter danxiaensis]|uniref:histone H1 n=1 Tax=Rubrolithibacter danxiaensis TaxID=3390805 RepID=UPI003BF7FC51